MKKWSVVVVVALFAIWAAQDIIHDFIASDTIHYFTDQPHRLLYVVLIAVTGGLVAFVLDRLTPRARRSVRLLTFASAASCATLYIGYFLFELARLRSPLRAFDGTGWFALLPLCIGIVAALLWFEFYRVLKRRIPDNREA